MKRSRFTTYWRVWYTTASNVLQQTFISPWTNALFFFGKSVRFAMMMVFLFVIRQSGATMAGYSTQQLVVFFLVYQILDVSTQILFRGVYMFTALIREGRFDAYLSKPISPLFMALTGHPDLNDTLFLAPVLLVSGWIIAGLNLSFTITHLVWFSLLFANGFLIATGLHILVLAAGIILTEVDGVVWLYRDLLRLGQFPVAVYAQPLRSLLTFVIPVALMISIPAESLVGDITAIKILGAVVAGCGFFGASLFVWKLALRQYSGAGG